MTGLFHAFSTILGLLIDSDAGMMIAGLAVAAFSFAGFYRLTAVDGD